MSENSSSAPVVKPDPAGPPAIDFTPADYPSLDLAYPFVQPAYDLAVRRMDAAVHRIDSALRFASTLTLAIPVVAKAALPGLEWITPWSFLAGLAFLALFVLGAVSLTSGGLKLIDPGELFESWLDNPPAQFRKDLLYFAGEDFAANLASINRKGQAAVWMSWLFLLELLFLALWIAF